MPSVIPIIKIVVILVAAGILGNMFLTEARKARAARLPWYTPYFTLPGFLVLLSLALPAVLWLRGAF